MGSGASKDKIGVQTLKSKDIDKELEKERKGQLQEIKILLLGISGSGKSTIAKQMKIIHLGGFTVEERRHHRNLVYFAILETLFKLDWDALGVTEDERERINKIFSPKDDQTGFSPNNCTVKHASSNSLYTTDRMNSVTASASNEAMLRRHLLSVCHLLQRVTKLLRSNTILNHFAGKLDEVLGDEYAPSEIDILVTRTPTTGVSEIKFMYKSHRLRVIDVGGQRSERRKWIHCFDNVNATIFVVDLSCFDEVIEDDGITNKVEEALQVFEEVASSPALEEIPFILFFNKMDRLKDKLKFVSLVEHYPDYEGDNSYKSATEYLKTKFQQAYYRSNSGALYSYFTTATETDNIDKVFSAVVDIMVKESLKDAGLT